MSTTKLYMLFISMRYRISFLIVALVLLSGFSLRTFGQSASKKKQPPIKSGRTFWDRFEWVNKNSEGVHEINIIGGYSFNSTRGIWGKTPGAELRIFTLRYNRKLLYFNRDHLIEYVGELNLGADYNLTSDMKGYQPGNFTGFGAAPLGFQFNFFRQSPLQPFVKSSGGFLLFSKPFPDERGTRFNFTLDLGLGLEFILAENFSLTLGYKYHHMSNGQFGQVNPGVDSNIFYSGITIF